MYLEKTGKYTVEEVVLSIADVLEQQSVAFMIGALREATVTPFLKDGYDRIRAAAAGLELLPDGAVGDKPVKRLMLKKDGTDLELHIDPESMLIAGARLVPYAHVEMTKQRYPHIQQLEIVIEMVADRNAEPSTAAEQFAFAPPKDAVAATDMADMFSMRGAAARDFTLPAFEQGKQWKLSDHLGKKVIMLDFWATWCGPCRMEMPILEGIWEDYQGKDFLLLCVNVGEGPPEVAAFLAELDLNVPVALDSDSAVAEKYGVDAFPTVMIIGKDGRVSAIHRGIPPNAPDKVLRNEVDAALKAGQDAAQE
jgi:thiol-disulfide isomerase/thioredoxin